MGLFEGRSLVNVFDKEGAEDGVVGDESVLDEEAEGGDADACDEHADKVGHVEARTFEAKEEGACGSSDGTCSRKGDSDEERQTPFAILFNHGLEFFAAVFDMFPNLFGEPRKAAHEA